MTVAVLAASLHASRAAADTEAPPTTYTKTTANGRYVFVMIAPIPVEEEVRCDQKSGYRGREIRNKYERSGLYRNDESRALVWTVDWYAQSVEVSSDGTHIIRLGPWPTSTSQEAVSFFANGTLLRTYRIRELVSIPWALPRTVSHFRWQKTIQFDDSALTFTVTTLDGNRFVFDVRSGSLLSARRPALWAVSAAACLVALTAGFVALRRHGIRTRRTAPKPGAAPDGRSSNHELPRVSASRSVE
jgi:hypothetical protein